MSLAQAQLERERLKMQLAEQEYRLLQEGHIEASAAQQIEASLKGIIDKAKAVLIDQVLAALAGESEENRIHYLLSDAINSWLSGLARQVEALLGTAKHTGQERRMVRAFVDEVQPKALLTVSAWAEQNRVLSTGSNLPGRWDNRNAPHAVEIMESLSQHSPCRSVTLMKASGVSGTEIGLNWVGYVLAHAKKDMLHVVPTLELRNRTFNPKLKRLIAEVAALKELASTASRDESNRADMLELGAVRLIKSGANSADSLRAEHVPYVLADELDAFPWDVGGEGDPITLIENRQKTFTRAKSFYLSTPTQRDFSIIEMLFQKGDRRYRYVPCPHCARRHKLLFANFRWQLDKQAEAVGNKLVTKAWFVCTHCGAKIDEADKNAMLDGGVWVAENPKQTRHRSYHINAFYIKSGLGESWAIIAQKWLDAQGDSNRLKAFINTYLAETWAEEGEHLETAGLLARLESFSNPMPATLRVAGVDVQADRLEITIDDYAHNEESWGQAHIILEGDTALDRVWQLLEQTVAELRCKIVAVDAGYRTDQVYAWCQGKRWAIPVKGAAGMARPLLEDKTKRAQRLRRRRKAGQSPEPVGVDQGKAIIYARLKMPKPKQEAPSGTPGYIHFQNIPDFDDEYFAQLTAERLVTKKRSGREYQEWQKTRSRNEALDCKVYALVAFRLRDIAGVRFLSAEKQANRAAATSTGRRVARAL